MTLMLPRILVSIDPFPDVKAYADATDVVVTIYGEKGVTQVLVVTIYG